MTKSLSPDALLSLMLAISMVTGLVIATVMARALRSAGHVKFWALACLLIALAFLLVALRGRIPDIVSILVANLMFLVGYGSVLACFAQMTDRSQRPAWMLTTFASATFVGAYFGGAPRDARIVPISAAIAIFSALSARLLFLAAAQVAPYAARIGGTAMVLNAVAAVGRLVVASGGTGFAPDLREFVIGPIFMAVTILVATAMNGAIALMTSESLQGNLRQKVRELENSRARLAETLAERRNVTEMLTHEFNSGLNRIGSSVAVLSENGATSDELALIRQTVRRMSEQIEDVLGATNIEDVIAEPDFASLSARDIAQDLCREYQIACPALPDGPDTFDGDRILVHIALSNLLDNAMKYSGNPEATTLQVDLRPTEVAFTVTDSGPGIPRRERGRVFEKYYRGSTTRQSAGTGLGLYFSRRIVARHGGRILLAARPSRVTLVFPRTAARQNGNAT